MYTIYQSTVKRFGDTNEIALGFICSCIAMSVYDIAKVLTHLQEQQSYH